MASMAKKGRTLRLQDKICLITGGASGLGLGLVERFVREGATVAIADIDESGAAAAAKSVSAGGALVSSHALDISSLPSTEEVVTEIVAKWGRVDVLVNNAALYRGLDLVSTSEDYLERVLQVNLLGVWRMSRAVTGPMCEQGAGRIINVGSDAAYGYFTHPMVGEELPNFSYGLSKWGVHGLTKFMAYVLGPKGINVNCISPGVILTDATKEVVPQETIEQLEQTVPLRRSLQPEDVTGTAVFFASADADLITGQILCVDAGMFMPT
jgi:3-oxoacyl-[acyl-carrier protein] reductase